jgi:cleavage and polyadenylation specificity factor subunit 1
VVDVVPEPGVPETDLKLKLVAKEEVKGAVTALSQIGSQGFLLAAQGQKCMVRGLKEDLSILPVAFMDMRYYVNVAKELKGTGLCILGDAISGLWFTGYSVCLETFIATGLHANATFIDRKSHTRCSSSVVIR